MAFICVICKLELVSYLCMLYSCFGSRLGCYETHRYSQNFPYSFMVFFFIPFLAAFRARKFIHLTQIMSQAGKNCVASTRFGPIFLLLSLFFSFFLSRFLSFDPASQPGEKVTIFPFLFFLFFKSRRKEIFSPGQLGRPDHPQHD